jgi:antitoxin HicB
LKLDVLAKAHHGLRWVPGLGLDDIRPLNPSKRRALCNSPRAFDASKKSATILVTSWMMSSSILVDELLDAMKAAKVTRAELAKRMGTSRTEVYRLLDPDNTGVTLATLARATVALGLDFQVSVTAAKRRARAA